MKSPMKVMAQLLCLCSAFVAVVLAIGGAGAALLEKESRSMQSLYADRVVPLSQLKTVADMYAVNIVDTAHKTRDGALTPSQALQSIEQAQATIAQQWKAYTGTFLVPQETALIQKIAPLMKTADESVLRLASLVRSGDHDALAAYTASDMYPDFDPLQGVIADLIQVQLDVAADANRTSMASATRAEWGLLGSVLLAALLGGAGSLIIARRLVKQLGAEPHEVRDLAQAVASGDLTRSVSLRAGDTDSVMATMKTMMAQLGILVASVRLNADSVAVASVQIEDGNLNLSQRTEEQASALEQTAASMEQIGATVRINADNAQEAHRLAKEATEDAVTGGRVVTEVVQTMEGIDESSRRIADIIGVIDGIAFQTNILALNAAVEAARAGEQGRGFAVVAGEVRNLAQRSAEAAKEIKGLITTSVERVQKGSSLVTQAGSTIGKTVDSIQRLAGVVGEITSASREQSNGIEQVGQAVTQMDQTTQQNAALVEESAAAASSLKAQAQKLVQAVSVFRLDAKAL
jgi:methyl-accepting chemotaxis protein